MTAKTEICQYVIFTELGKFDTTDICVLQCLFTLILTSILLDCESRELSLNKVRG